MLSESVLRSMELKQTIRLQQPKCTTCTVHHMMSDGCHSSCDTVANTQQEWTDSRLEGSMLLFCQSFWNYNQEPASKWQPREWSQSHQSHTFMPYKVQSTILHLAFTTDEGFHQQQLILRWRRSSFGVAENHISARKLWQGGDAFQARSFWRSAMAHPVIYWYRTIYLLPIPGMLDLVYCQRVIVVNVHLLSLIYCYFRLFKGFSDFSMFNITEFLFV